MRRLAVVLVLLLSGSLPVQAQVLPTSWPAGVTPPVFVFGSGGFVSGTGVAQGPILFPDGTCPGAPSITFASETTLGFCRSAAASVKLQGALQTTGVMTATDYNAGAGNFIGWSGRSYLRSTADGLVSMLTNSLAIGSVFKVDALPTIASGFGTSPSIVAGSTPLAGSISVGTGGVATTGVVNFNGTAFPNVPVCVVGSSLTNVPTRITAVSTTQLTVSTSTAWTSGDFVNFICISPK